MPNVLKIHIRFAQPADAQQGDNLQAIFECAENTGAPSMPFWQLFLTNGDTVLVNMAMVLFVKIEKELLIKGTVPGGKLVNLEGV